jgi:hypothetical protein
VADVQLCRTIPLNPIFPFPIGAQRSWVSVAVSRKPLDTFFPFVLSSKINSPRPVKYDTFCRHYPVFAIYKRRSRLFTQEKDTSNRESIYDSQIVSYLHQLRSPFDKVDKTGQVSEKHDPEPFSFS